MRKIIIFIPLIFLFSSCQDFLNRDHPTGITDSKFWKTQNQAEAALNSCKHLPQGTMYYSSPYLTWVHMEGMTDNMYHNANFNASIVQIGNGSVSPTSGGYINDVWNNWYSLIRRCNRVLDNIDSPYFSNEEERERIRIEARVWRAWYHMQLLLYYGINSGIPIVDKTLAPAEIYRPRNSVDECIEFINKEFDEIIASKVLPFKWDESRRGRMSQADVLTLQMDLNLQFKKYKKARDCAAKIIDSKEFELYYSNSNDDDPGKNYRDLFRYAGQQNKERILFAGSGLKEFWFRGMSKLVRGQGATNPLKSIVDTYETLEGKILSELSDDERAQLEKNPLALERDPRLFASIMLPGDNKTVNNYVYEPFNPESGDAIGNVGTSRSGYLLKKFLDPQDEAHPYGGSLDFMLYRYAEVLLTYVECLVELDDWQNPDVAKYINMIRNRAGLPDYDKSVYNSQEKVRELYRRERRVELAFEGKRYYDIRRWGIANKVMKGRALGAYNPLKKEFVIVEERQYVSPKNDSWPIPQSEITVNNNIKQPQGW